MNTEFKTGVIKIKSMPNGGAPETIKRHWIGVEMPCLFYDPACYARDVLSKKLINAKPSYVVLQAEALDALAKTAPEDVLDWWKSIGYPASEVALWAFDADCVETLQTPPTKGELTGENN